jgi:hypothetical protein
MLVAADKDAESRELVGVPVYVVDDADPRFGVKLRRVVIEPGFFGVFSAPEELCACSSLLIIPPLRTSECSCKMSPE